MSHMLLIVEPVGQRASRTAEEGREVYARMTRFGESLRARGKLLAAESLASQASAARVHTREGKTQVVDGPFAEAKEMIGGFFMLATDDRQQALDIARACPAAAWATVEVRGFGPCFDDSKAPG